jgi:four helix bundle protein
VLQRRSPRTSLKATVEEAGATTHFLAIAKGSLNETETFLFLAIRLGYLREQEAAPTLGLITEVGKMLTTLRSRLI